jgi:precorrin-2 dehydrogenase/sirohydrochlorin ferrochelatase
MGMMIDLQPSFGRALVVGGGTIAQRKVQTLVEAGFSVAVIAPDVAPRIREQPGIEFFEREFAAVDVAAERWALVFACTNSREVNRTVGEAARGAGVPVVVTDRAEESTFYTPGLVRDGRLAVAVSTGGAAPALTRELTKQLRELLGSGWAERVEAAAEARTATRPRSEPVTQ